MNNYTYKYITTAATATFAGEMKKVVLGAINVNKVLTGTVTIRTGTTVIGVLPISTPIGQYWFSGDNGTLIPDLQIVNSATEDITVFYKNI